jgi:hypothetical protein
MGVTCLTAFGECYYTPGRRRAVEFEVERMNIIEEPL